ncbi:MAG: FdhF/YdeP family oxidoreductase [Phycisphaerales bacterium]
MSSPAEQRPGPPPGPGPGRVPSTPADLTISAPATEAGGLGAVRSTFRHMKNAGYGPVAAAGALRRMNQHAGFDCPGCAWPDPDEKRSFLAEYCENGAKALAEEATVSRADAAFFAGHSIPTLRGWTDHELGRAGRLVEPLVREPGGDHYVSITWEDALGRIAEALAACDAPDDAAFYTSGRTSNEAAFLYQLMVRRFGTNNLPDCSNMCHESSGVGLGETIGIGKGTVSLADVESADVLLVMGQNPGTNHPRMLTALQAAKARGATIVAVNPLPEAGLMAFRHPQRPTDLVGRAPQLADIWLPVRIGGDIALLKGIMLELDRIDGAFDHAFIDARTDGVDAMLADLRRHEMGDLERESGIPRADMRRVAELITARPGLIVCWAMGLTQHRHGVENVQEIVNLLLLRGAIGKPGAGACPVRGHSNVQGDRTMGIVERPPAWLVEGVRREFGFDVPAAHGLDTVGTIAAMEAGRLGVFVAMGGNFLSAAPDTDRVASGLARCGLTVHVSTKLNRSHLIPGETSIILPCLGRSETDVQNGPRGSVAQLVTVENSMSVVHTSQGDRTPASEHLRSEPWIVAHLAAAMERAEAMPPIDGLDWATLANDYDAIRDRIARTVPGFTDFNVRVRQRGGFVLPNGPREGTFDAVGGRARFTVNPVPAIDDPPDTLRMMTIRSHDQFNTTIYGLEDRYRGVTGDRRIVFMHAADMVERGLAERDAVDVRSIFGGVERLVRNFRVVGYEIPRGCCATYFPEANPLVPLEHHAPRSRTPASKLVHVRVTASSR